MPGYLKNCIVVLGLKKPKYKYAEYDATEFFSDGMGHNNKWLFMSQGDNLYCQLDGYAIIPKEEYYKLKAEAENGL